MSPTVSKGARFVGVIALAGALVAFGASAVSASSKRPPKKNAPAAVVIKVEKPPAESLSETGSTLLYPLWNLWAPAYHHAYSNVTLTTGGTGSGTGIADAADGTVDVGSSDAYLSSSQLSATPSLLNVPLAISYQVITYNIPGVNAHLDLNGTLLAQIYTGAITNWNDPAIAAANPNVTLPNLPIVALHRSDGSGDTFLFTQYLSRQDGSWNSSISYGTTVSWPTISNALGESGNGGMVSGCAATKGCIAYVGISYLAQVLGGGLSYAALLNGAKQYELPNQKTAAAEAAGYSKITPASGTISMINGHVKGGYPIVNYEYAIVSKSQSDASRATAIRSLLEWAINAKDGNSGRFLNQVNFLTLPTKVADQSYAQIKKIK